MIPWWVLFALIGTHLMVGALGIVVGATLAASSRAKEEGKPCGTIATDSTPS